MGYVVNYVCVIKFGGNSLKEAFLKLKNRCVYRWWVLPVYALFYWIMFQYLEKRVHANSEFYILSTPFDSRIPFCEYFIIPYDLWFFYIMGTVAFFVLFNQSRQEYYRFEVMMIVGMTAFLLISYVFPNGLDLRPETFPRENFCTELVRFLYRSDTPTNVFPSIHVYNSLCAYEALSTCSSLRKHRKVVGAFGVLTVLIILSTMFLKQHSVLDVGFAIILNVVCYQIVYRPVWDGSEDAAASVDRTV
jgi:membrane-associated phospholipid phosphatase